MSFNLVTPKSTRAYELVAKASSLVTTRSALFFQSLTTGLLQLAGVATTSNQVLYRASETLAAADARTNVHSLILSTDDVFLVDTTANSNAGHNGQRMILDATGLLLTNTGTDVAGTTGVFQQVAVVGVAADRKIIARKV